MSSLQGEHVGRSIGRPSFHSHLNILTPNPKYPPPQHRARNHRVNFGSILDGAMQMVHTLDEQKRKSGYLGDLKVRGDGWVQCGLMSGASDGRWVDFSMGGFCTD